MAMPPQKPHRSRQDYGTPPELIAACERRFGPLSWDVAASAENTLIDGGFFSPGGIDAMTDDWAARFERCDLLFLNPPFGGIGPEWAPLVGKWTRRLPWLRLLMLTPASVGSEWFQRYVHRRAMVLALSPRLHFVGADDPYPKDCMLSAFGFGVTGFDVWRWDEDAAMASSAATTSPVAASPKPSPAPAVKRARQPAKRLQPPANTVPI